MGQKIDLSYQVQGILPPANGGVGGLATLQFADNETPSGVTDGVNSTFTLANAPSPSGSLIFVVKNPGGNGFVLLQTLDYTIAGSSVNTLTPPVSGASIRTWYRYSQFPAQIRGEILVLSDATRFSFSSGYRLSEALVLSDGIRLVLSPVIIQEYDLMIMSDAFTKNVIAAKSPSDTMTLHDAFAKLLV